MRHSLPPIFRAASVRRPGRHRRCFSSPALLAALLALCLAALAPTAARAQDLLVVNHNAETYSDAGVLRYQAGTGAPLGAFVSTDPALNGGIRPELQAIAFGPTGDLFLADFGNHCIQRYDGTTGAYKGAFVAAGVGGLQYPVGIVFGPDGNLWASSGDGPGLSIKRYNGSTGAYIDTPCPPGTFTLANPFYGPDKPGYSEFWDPSSPNYGGDPSAAWGDPLVSAPELYCQPIDLVFGADGNLYVSTGTLVPSTWGGGPSPVLRYNPETHAFDAFVPIGSGGLNGGRQLAFGPDGSLYVESGNTDSVLRYDGKTGDFLGTALSGAPEGVGRNLAMAFGPDGKLYVSWQSAACVKRYAPSGDGTFAYDGDFVSPGAGGITHPSWMLFDRGRTTPGADVQVAPISTAAITFSTITATGITSVTPLESTTTPLPANFQVAAETGGFATFFDLHTTAAFSGPVTLSFGYDAARFPYDPVANPGGAQPALLHLEGGQWKDVTTSVDAANHRVYGQVTSFSPFAIGELRRYEWSGFLAPVNPDGSSVFRQGSTVAVKFRLAGADVAKTDLAAKLSYARVGDDGSLGEVNEAVSTASASPGNLFRYDAAGGQYVFNLGTKAMSPGRYQLRADLGDGLPRTVTVGLKK